VTLCSRRTALVRSTLLLGGAVIGMSNAGVAAASPPKIVAVGDIACQSFSQSDGEGACRSDEVAALVTSMDVDGWLPLGDIQYSNGTLTEFQKVYDLQFGHLNAITYPAPGNHEYETPGAQGYFDYFGTRAHGPEGYYSFNLGTWHIVALNSDICRDDPGCGPGTPQYEWLRADLLAHDDAVCTLVFQHHPTFDWRTITEPLFASHFLSID